MMAYHHAMSANPEVVVSLIAVVPEATAGWGVALLNGIATGWPEEKPPQLTDRQRAALVAAASKATGATAEAFGRVAARWGLPGVFKAP